MVLPCKSGIPAPQRSTVDLLTENDRQKSIVIPKFSIIAIFTPASN